MNGDSSYIKSTLFVFLVLFLAGGATSDMPDNSETSFPLDISALGIESDTSLSFMLLVRNKSDEELRVVVADLMRDNVTIAIRVNNNVSGWPQEIVYGRKITLARKEAAIETVPIRPGGIIGQVVRLDEAQADALENSSRITVLVTIRYKRESDTEYSAVRRQIVVQSVARE